MFTTTRTALRLLLASPLAAGAIVLGGFAGTAHADGVEPGPIVIAQPEDDGPQGPGEIALPDSEPQPDPAPEPDKGPGEITNPEDDGDPKPHGPGGFTNPEDDDEPGPQIPGDKNGPSPSDDDPQIPGDKNGPKPGDEPGDEPKDQPKDEPKDEPVADGDDVDQVAGTTEVPNRIDAGAGPVDDEGDGTLAWVLVGGGVLTAAGAAAAAQRMRRTAR